jgi:pentapeptide MXKDX repeat protein
MKRLFNSIVCAGFVFVGAQAFAGDAVQSDSSTNHQMMKDCVAKHAANNDGMSKTDVKKACSDEMSVQKAQSSATTKAPTDSPTEDNKIGTGETSTGETPKN